MFGLSFRAVSPKGLYARSVLLTLLPLSLILALTTLYYYNGHLRAVNSKLSQGVARQLALIDRFCVSDAYDEQGRLSIEQSFGLSLECDWQDDATSQTGKQRFLYSGLVREQFDEILLKPTTVYLAGNGRQIDVRIPSGEKTIRVLMDRKRVVDINSHVFIVWVVMITFSMAFVALAFLRNHVRSVLRLTEVAQAFARGQEMKDFSPSGAREVRAAANAVIDMRKSLIGFAEQRTSLLAGVSHDLRTPLARLQLQLAMQDQSEDVLAARSDIRDMEAMLEEYLAFARGEDGETTTDIDMTTLVADIVTRFEGARFVQPRDNEKIEVFGRPLALRRAISNLVGNAVTYADLAEVSLVRMDGGISVRVDDNGPGIPPEQYEDAFRPFARLNEARTQNHPGVGLGLALTRDTARSHGGKITLQPSPLGGLRAEMFLPD